MGGARSFPWANFVVPLAAIVLHLLVGFSLIRWLYSEEKAKSGDNEEEAIGEEPAP